MYVITTRGSHTGSLRAMERKVGGGLQACRRPRALKTISLFLFLALPRSLSPSLTPSAPLPHAAA